MAWSNATTWSGYLLGRQTTGTSATYDWDCKEYVSFQYYQHDGYTEVKITPYLKVYKPSADSYGGDATTVTFYTRVTNSTSGNNYKRSSHTFSFGYNSTVETWYGTAQTFIIYPDANGNTQADTNWYFYSSMGSANNSDYVTRNTSIGIVHTFGLPSIAMNSSISNSTNSSSYGTFGSNVTFSISRPGSQTHTLTYTWNGTTYTIGTGLETSATYVFKTDLCSAIPTQTSASIVVTCTSSNGTTSSTTVYLNVPSYTPSVSLSISPNNSGYPWGNTYVIGHTKINYTISGSTSYGAAIWYCTMRCGYFNSANTFSGTTGTVSGSDTMTATVTDSRDRTSGTASQSFTAYSYYMPQLTAVNAYRCSSNGTENSEGTYINVSISYNIAPVNNINAKSATVVLYNASGTQIDSKNISLSAYSGTVSSGLFSNIDTNSRYTIRVYLKDSIYTGGVTVDDTVPAKFIPFSARKGGKGITFGQQAKKDGYHFYGETTVNDCPVLEYTVIDSW